MAENKTLEDLLLNFLSKKKIAISVYLKNGIKLNGNIKMFDNSIILLKNPSCQIVYKHSISTIVSKKDIEISIIPNP